MAALDRFRARRQGQDEVDGISGLNLLSRFNGAIVDKPAMFGGGACTARVELRAPLAAHGYHAVVEQLVTQGQVPERRWCTFAVTLPNLVPTIVVDHRCAEGLPGVPGASITKDTGDLEFDLDYLASADDPDALAELLVQSLRTALLRRPVQRMSFSGRTLLLRTFDGVALDEGVLRALRALAAEILRSTPAHVDALHPGQGQPFPRGFVGPAD